MWIRRLEVFGFGKIANSAIDFEPDKLNLVIEPNEYGKSTIADAICAVLYDFPQYQRTRQERLRERDAKRPLSGGHYKASLDLTLPDRTLRLVRDFQQRNIRVFDLTNSDREITEQFLTGPNLDEVGYRLLGIDRDVFQKTCFLGQRELDKNNWEEDLKLTALIQSIADTSGGTSTAADAISELEKAEDCYSLKGKKMRIDRAIQTLAAEQSDLLNRASQLESERQKVKEDMERLEALNCQIEEVESEIKSMEYLELERQKEEIDGRLAKAQERQLRLSELKERLQELAAWKDFPIQKQKQVTELWTNRLSRIKDKERLSADLLGKKKQLELKDLEIREGFETVCTFCDDDAQSLRTLGKTLESVLVELAEAEKKRYSEQARLSESNLDLANLKEVRQTLTRLDRQDLDSAYVFSAEIRQGKEIIEQSKKQAEQARLLIGQIEQERQDKLSSRRHVMEIMLVCLAFVALLLSFAKLASLVTPSIIVGACLLLATVLASYYFLPGKDPHVWRQAELTKAARDEERAIKGQREAETKIAQAEQQLDSLARKAGLASGAKFLDYLLMYATAAGQFQELDLTEQIASSQKVHAYQIRSELEAYFKKAKQPVKDLEDLKPRDAFVLAESINSFREATRALVSSRNLVRQQEEEVNFLLGEIRDLDSLLKEHFCQAGVSQTDDIQYAYEEFLRQVDLFCQWREVQLETRRLEEDSTTELVASCLPEIVEKLQAQRQEISTKIGELVKTKPGLSRLEKRSQDSAGGQITDLRAKVKSLQLEIQELTVHVRSATKNYDDHYLSCLEELSAIEHQLKIARQTKQALELARDTFLYLSKETHSQWSCQLNVLSRQMLPALSCGFESLQFDQNLRVTVRRSGLPEPMQPHQITSQLSCGTQEQLFWLTRLILLSFLAGNVVLPIILDEPFCQADDERFLSMVRFLASTIIKHHQVILFSCHHQRHQWLLHELAPSEREMLYFCGLKPLA